VLHKFLSSNRAAILDRARLKVAARSTPRATEEEIESGIPLFVDQIIEIMRAMPGASGRMAASASVHGGSLMRRGFTVAQVVNDYGSVCQAVTELADEMKAPITAEEFKTFNLCLDDAIAGAVTEFARVRDESIADAGRLHLGELAHELRNALGAAIVSYETLRTGTVGLEGGTGAVLGRSLRRLSSLIDRSLTEVRLEAGIRSPERVSVRELLEEIAVGASMEAHAGGHTLYVAPGEPGVDVLVDRQLVVAAIANLTQNAFKFTRPTSRVFLRASATDRRVLIEVEDECGGLPPGREAELFRPFEQRGADRSGLGLGLSISHKSVETNGGELRVRDLPGTGCVFTIDLPRLQAR
jgi:signal transduction histidine kinase